MSVHVGWPDLSDARRRSLCVIIDELKASTSDLDLLEACLLEQGKKIPENTMAIATARYNEIARLAELQFPEIRLMEGAEASCGLVRTNQELRRAMSIVDKKLSLDLGCTVSELMHFYRHKTLMGSLAPMPKPDPKAKRKEVAQ